MTQTDSAFDLEAVVRTRKLEFLQRPDPQRLGVMFHLRGDGHRTVGTARRFSHSGWFTFTVRNVGDELTERTLVMERSSSGSAQIDDWSDDTTSWVRHIRDTGNKSDPLVLAYFEDSDSEVPSLVGNPRLGRHPHFELRTPPPPESKERPGFVGRLYVLPDDPRLALNGDDMVIQFTRSYGAKKEEEVPDSITEIKLAAVLMAFGATNNRNHQRSIDAQELPASRGTALILFVAIELDLRPAATLR